MSTTEQVERRQWEELPEIYVRLHKDELGYPPKDWEQLKAEPTEKPDVFRIKNIPHYARGMALEDEVLVTTSDEGYSPAFKSVVKHSGYSTVRLLISENEDQEKLIDHFTNLDTLLEFYGRLVALAIPKHRFDEVSEYVFNEKQKGRWDAEDGFLIIDDPGDEATKGGAG
jgi:hypothetical protein